MRSFVASLLRMTGRGGARRAGGARGGKEKTRKRERDALPFFAKNSKITFILPPCLFQKISHNASRRAATLLQVNRRALCFAAPRIPCR